MGVILGIHHVNFLTRFFFLNIKQEYTAVLGGATAHSKGAERKSWASLQTQSEVTLRGYTQEESVSDPIARRTAIRKLRHDPTLVVGLNEKMDDSMVIGLACTPCSA